jgi:hypothetical protein
MESASDTEGDHLLLLPSRELIALNQTGRQHIPPPHFAATGKVFADDRKCSQRLHYWRSGD